MRLRYIYQGKYPLGKYQHTRRKHLKFAHSETCCLSMPLCCLSRHPKIAKYQALPERIPSPMPSASLDAGQAIRLMPARA